MSRKTVINFYATSGHGVLSNFHTSTIVFEGKTYPSVEHVYQAYKTLNEESRELIRKAASPAEAKKLGRGVELRRDWEIVRIPLMREFLRLKFENPLLRQYLLDTGDADLIHGNTWNDRFWGVCRGSGQNWLGRLLMDLRAEYRKITEEENSLFESSPSV